MQHSVARNETGTLTEQVAELQIGYAGTSIPRKEDRRLVQGEGVFADDIKAHGMGYVHFVRSPYAHARIVSVDVSQAEALEGVYGTLTPDEVAAQTDPFFELTTAPGSQIKDYALAAGEADGWASVTLGREGTGIVNVAATVRGGQARIAIGCVSAVPVVVEAEADEVSVRKAVADAGLDPPSDVHASADYRRHLAQVLAWRAVTDAVNRVGGD